MNCILGDEILEIIKNKKYSSYFSYEKDPYKILDIIRDFITAGKHRQINIVTKDEKYNIKYNADYASNIYKYHNNDKILVNKIKCYDCIIEMVNSMIRNYINNNEAFEINFYTLKKMNKYYIINNMIFNDISMVYILKAYNYDCNNDKLSLEKLIKKYNVERQMEKLKNNINDDIIRIVTTYEDIIFGRDPENTNDKTFDYIQITFRLYTNEKKKITHDEVYNWVRGKLNKIIQYGFKILSTSNKYNEFNVPINFLKVTDVRLTATDRLILNFELKEIKNKE